MEKAKAKQNTKGWLNQSFNFISPYPIDVCAHLLNSQNSQEEYAPLSIRALGPSFELEVKIQPIDEEMCGFQMKWKDKKRRNFIFPIYYATADGYLKRWGGKSTHVFGTIKVARMYAIWNIIAWVIALQLFVGYVYPTTRDNFLLCLPVIWTVIIGLNLYHLVYLRRKMSNVLEDALAPLSEEKITSVRHD